jgi:hypothetical protein
VTVIWYYECIRPGEIKGVRYIYNMMNTDRLQARTIITSVVLVPLTAVSIYLVYGSYLFSKWPWIRFSVVMSLLTCLWTYTIWFFMSDDGKTDSSSFTGSVLLGFMVVPFDFLLLCPPLETLGLSSDSHAYTLIIVLAVVHGLGFCSIQRGIRRYVADSQNGGK